MAEVIVALDVGSRVRALDLVEQLPEVRWVKVGSVLFVREGPDLIHELIERGLNVFLDLKWHDIPSTVAEAARAASEAGVALATIHALGGAQMIRAAVEAAGEMRLAAVTVLTSHGETSYAEATRGAGRVSIDDEVVRLATLAIEAGAGAVVASPHEVHSLREAVGPDPWIVVPGIRVPGAAVDDQRRTADPATAVRHGASHLVVGRPILRDENPSRVYSQICQAAGCAPT